MQFLVILLIVILALTSAREIDQEDGRFDPIARAHLPHLSKTFEENNPDFHRQHAHQHVVQGLDGPVQGQDPPAIDMNNLPPLPDLPPNARRQFQEE